ncbi:VWA domain-containing protein [Thalassotalea sp. Y01]|uniref:vWA domain-containing protein n=1 Tax=Thalassotalea sp. Y01 TaxID=2729613 RepID=UPI00145DD509|nr:VWA domain-containing protein [Thalassotalea sp. Y01]NMP17447.1 VWA domain-containing protein [Thalassotalea sp. Y01]
MNPLAVMQELGLGYLNDFHFIRPLWLLSLIPLFLFYRFVVTKDDSLSKWRVVMSDKMIVHLSIDETQQRMFTPKHLFAVFAVVSTLVMAGPAWKKQATEFFVDESVLIIALDVSSSMQSTDLQPSRLLRAKQKINALLDQRGDAKTALVVYSGTAHIAMPITKDRQMIRHFLDVLDTDLLPDKAPQQSSTLKPLASLLKQTTTASTVLLLTDKTDSDAVNQFKSFFSEQQHQLLVWAIAENPDSGLPAANGLSSQQLQQLQQLADTGHGRMVPFTHNGDDIDTVINNIENNLFASDDSAQPWHDEGYWLLFVLLPLQALWFRRGWTMQW